MNLKIFLAASYSSEVDYSSGKVNPVYVSWLKQVIANIESYGHEVFCALRADQHKINSHDPALAFRLDLKEITGADGMIAIVTENASVGVQTEIGIAIHANKKIIIAHDPAHSLAYFNSAIINAGKARELHLPLKSDPFKAFRG